MENKNNDVYTGFVNIANNEDAMLIEKDAREELRKDIQKIINKNPFKGKWIYPNNDYELNYIHQYGFYDYPFGQLPLFINALVNCIHTFDEIQMAYVYNDYDNVKGFTERVKDIYNSYIRLATDTTIEPSQEIDRESKCAKLTFPLINTNKVSEIIYLYNMDQVYQTNLLRNTVHCNFGFKDFTCTCSSCQNYHKAYEQAMNILKGCYNNENASTL